MFVLPHPALSDDADWTAHYVVGEAEAVLEPDYIEWVVDIRTENKSPKSALDINDTMLEKLMDVVDDADIDSKDIVAGQPEIKQVFLRGSSKISSIENYQSTLVHRRVTFHLRDLDEMPDLLIALHELGLPYSMAFKSSAFEKTWQALKLDAIKHAKSLAAEQAAVLGQTIGPATELEVGPHYSRTARGGLFADDHEERVDMSVAGPDGKVRLRVYAIATFRLNAQ